VEPAPARAAAAEPKPVAEPAATVPARTQPAPAEQAEPRPPAPPKRVLHYSELPPGLKQGVPKIAITGSSYTDEPELRMAVINERVVKEGDEVAPGVVLESIGADGIVLSYRGYRFRPAP
jgi:general secretion pathway protein B